MWQIIFLLWLSRFSLRGLTDYACVFVWISFRSSSQSRPLACLERPVPLFLVPSSESHDIHICVLTVSRLSLASCSSFLLLRLNLLQWSIIKNYYRIFFPNCSVANYRAHSHFHCYSQWGWPWTLDPPCWTLLRTETLQECSITLHLRGAVD